MKQSPFHHVHLENNAAMIEQNDRLIPDHYGDVSGEQLAARDTMAVFDLSHCFRIRVLGKNSGDAVRHHVENITLPATGRQTTGNLDSDGDIIVQGHDNGYLLIGMPPSHQCLLEKLEQQALYSALKIKDETESTAMVALAGPEALPLLKEKLPIDISYLEPGDVQTENIFFMRITISLEEWQSIQIVRLILPVKMASLAWDMLIKYGQSRGARLAGQTTWNTLIQSGSDNIC